MSNKRGNVLYRMFNVENQLLYVGVTANPTVRLYAHEANQTWWHEVVLVTLEHFETAAQAALAEGAAIIEENPKYNRVARVLIGMSSEVIRAIAEAEA